MICVTIPLLKPDCEQGGCKVLTSHVLTSHKTRSHLLCVILSMVGSIRRREDCTSILSYITLLALLLMHPFQFPSPYVPTVTILVCATCAMRLLPFNVGPLCHLLFSPAPIALFNMVSDRNFMCIGGLYFRF